MTISITDLIFILCSYNFSIFAAKIKTKQDRQCTYNVTLRQFMQSMSQWKINMYYIFWACIYRLTYPPCNAHAPYFHLWPARLYTIFPGYLI